MVLGVIGAAVFFAVWEIGHHLTPEDSQRFLTSLLQVISTLATLVAEKGFLGDVGISALRTIGSFFAACLVAVPLGILMGRFSFEAESPSPRSSTSSCGVIEDGPHAVRPGANSVG